MPPPAVTDEQVQLCPALNVSPSRVILANVTGSYGCRQRVHFAHADGRISIAVTFGDERRASEACTFIASAEVLVNDDFLLVTRDTDGASLFDRDGVLLVQSNSRDGIRQALVDRQAWSLLDTLEGWYVLGPLSRGVLPVTGYAVNGDRMIGWMDPVERSVTLVSRSVTIDSTQLNWVGDAFAGLVPEGDKMRWSRALPDESSFSYLPGFNADADADVRVVQQGDGWTFVGSFFSEHYWLVDDATLHVRPIHLVAPPGLRQFKDGNNDLGARLVVDVLDDGSLLDTFRSDSSTGLYRTTDGEAWQLVGKEVTGVQSVNGWGRQGTYVINSSIQPNGEPAVIWQAPAGFPRPLNATTQLVRESAGINIDNVSPRTQVQLSHRAVCAALAPLKDLDPIVTVKDLTTGQTQTVNGFSGSRFVWLE